MKKLFIILAVVAFLAPASVLAQAKVYNRTSKAVVLKSGNVESMITPRSSKTVANAPSSGSYTFELFKFDGMSETKVGSVTKTVTKSGFEISDNDINGVKTAAKGTDKKELGNANENQIYSSPNSRTVSVTLVNESGFSMEVLDGPFKGFALAGHDSTRFQTTVPQGMLQFTVKHETKTDQEREGRQYQETVYSTIVTQNQKRVAITEKNLSKTVDKEMYVYARSLCIYEGKHLDFVFVSGPWKGQALAYNDRTSSAKLYEGFGPFSIQFYGTDNIKRQADLEPLITKNRHILILKDLKNVKILK